MKLKNEIEYVFRILNYLSLQDKDRIVTSTEIAENENIPHLFSIRVLKKMEKKGLLKRIDSKDKREKMITLTEEGHAGITNARKVMVSTKFILLASLSEEESK